MNCRRCTYLGAYVTSTHLQMESGSEPYMVYGFSALSSLMDYYFYTSANGECSRVHLMVFLHNSPLTD